MTCPENPDVQLQNAIFIENLCKRYSKGPPVLQNLCMAVERRSIYGLLGASGCGKTTLLSCIIGLLQGDSGKLLVFGADPTVERTVLGKKLGYMPQEHALYGHLTPWEMILLYGRLMNMKSRDTKKRYRELKSLLDLPSTNQCISELSGGQQRRVSLALALTHAPKLLILDEPTVGLDPLLRKRIWDYLHNLVRTTETTILLTTHYTEEARNSNRIGVLRQGRLVAEDSPQNLLGRYDCDLLEEVVVKLCKKQESLSIRYSGAPDLICNQVTFQSNWRARDEEHGIAGRCNVLPFDTGDNLKNVRSKSRLSFTNQHLQRRKSYEPYKRRVSNSLQRIYAQSVVLLLAFLRLPSFAIVLICIPTIQVMLTIITFGSTMRNMPIGVVNQDLPHNMTYCEPNMDHYNVCHGHTLSCEFLSRLKENNFVILNWYDTEAEARNQVSLGNLWGYLRFPQNYSDHFRELLMENRFATNETLEHADIHVHLDYSDFTAASLLKKHLYETYDNYLNSFVKECGYGDGDITLFLRFDRPVYGTYGDDYTSFILPGIVTVSLSGILSFVAALLIIFDLQQGTLKRAYVAGISSAEVIFSHLITQVLIAILQSIILNLVIFTVFSLNVHGSIWVSMVFCILTAIYSAAFGLTLGVLVGDAVSALLVGMFIFPVFLLFGETLFSEQYMLIGWRYFGYLIPNKLPTQALRSSLIRGVEWNHPLVIPGLSYLIIEAIAFVLLSMFVFSKFRFK